MRRLVCGLALALVLAWPASAASSVVFFVNTAEDLDSGPCDATCSLRDAIKQSNVSASTDGTPIMIQLPAATLKRNQVFKAPEVTSPVIIFGAGARQTTILGSNNKDPGFSSRVLTVTGPGDGSPMAVELRDLTVAGGLSSATSSSTDPGQGGGISVRDAQLTLRRVTVRDNEALDDRGPTAATTASGGGIFTDDALKVVDSAILNNRATGTYDSSNNALSATGGGAYLQFATATITNSTIAGNVADGGPGIATGGGLALGFLGQLDGVTLAGNRATGTNGLKPPGGGNLTANPFAPPTVRGSIIAGGSAAAADGNCRQSAPGQPASVESQGGNVEDANQCNLNLPTDRVSIDPRLGALGDHGGPTSTRDLLAGSPAIDRAG